MAFTGRTKFSWQGETLKRLVGEAAAKALQNAGMDVRKATQRMMSSRKPLSQPRFWRVGERNGIPMVAVVRQIPKSEKVTSWKTSNWPKGFLRQDIQSDFDNRTQSVVIGPSKAPWLNQLHEFGGEVPLFYLPSNRPRRDYRGRRIPMSVAGRDGAYVGTLTNTPGIPGAISLGTRTVRGRGYMEIGLQASIHRIPPQFQDTIRRSGGSI